MDRRGARVEHAGSRRWTSIPCHFRHLSFSSLDRRVEEDRSSLPESARPSRKRLAAIQPWSRWSAYVSIYEITLRAGPRLARRIPFDAASTQLRFNALGLDLIGKRPSPPASPSCNPSRRRTLLLPRPGSSTSRQVGRGRGSRLVKGGRRSRGRCIESRRLGGSDRQPSACRKPDVSSSRWKRLTKRGIRSTDDNSPNAPWSNRSSCEGGPCGA